MNKEILKLVISCAGTYLDYDKYCQNSPEEVVDKITELQARKIESLFVKWATEIPYPDPITQQEEILKLLR